MSEERFLEPIMKYILVFTSLFFFMPLSARAEVPMIKHIEVDLSEQRLTYYLNGEVLNSILISSGLPRTPTPQGEFTIRRKLPLVRYAGRNADGTTYNYPRTKWNLEFLPRYWIHGAYWHNAFGNPRSHGCVNVSYKDMERLYIFAQVGMRVYIHE